MSPVMAGVRAVYSEWYCDHMANTWIVNLQHYLNQDGSIGIESSSGRRLAGHFAAIVQEASGDIDGEGRFPKVRCRRKPGRKPCAGEIESYIDPEDDAIVWRCPVCGDNGAIGGWAGTLWDLSEVATRH